MALHFAEDWLKFLQRLKGYASPRMLITTHRRYPALAIGDPHRHNLGIEAPRGHRSLGALLTLECVGIRFVSRNAVLPGKHLGRLAHQQVGKRTGKTVTIHGINELDVPHPVPPTRGLRVDQVRHPAHRFDAADQHDFGLAQGNRLGTASNGL